MSITCTESAISLDTYIRREICARLNVYIFEPVFRSAVAEQFWSPANHEIIPTKNRSPGRWRTLYNQSDLN